MFKLSMATMMTVCGGNHIVCYLISSPFTDFKRRFMLATSSTFVLFFNIDSQLVSKNHLDFQLQILQQHIFQQCPWLPVGNDKSVMAKIKVFAKIK